MTAVWLHQKTDLNYDGTCDYGNSNIEYMDQSKYLERKQGVDNSLQYRGALIADLCSQFVTPSVILPRQIAIRSISSSEILYSLKSVSNPFHVFE
jgi:hypothetical protein